MLRKPDRSRNEIKLSLEWNAREEKEKEGHPVQIWGYSSLAELMAKNITWTHAKRTAQNRTR